MTSELQPTHECFCGREIHEVAEGVWIGPRGDTLCYPREEGADGEATHEPCEELKEDA